MARKTYNDEFKTAAAKLVREQGYSIKKAAHSLGVDQGSIRTWVRRFAPAPVALAPDAPADQLHRENLRLREENRRLLMEREILPSERVNCAAVVFAGFVSERGFHAGSNLITRRDGTHTPQGESCVVLSG